MFEISIVCHVLCSWFWRGVGVSLFFGGLFWLVRRVFSGFWGFLCFLLVLLRVLGWVAGCGGFRGSGVGAPVSCSSFRGGWAGGCVCARPVVLLVVWFWLWSGSVAGFGVCVLPGFPLCGGGRVVPGFFCCLLWWGFSGVVFFRPVLLVSSGSAVLGPLLGCGFRGVGGLWGVSGWVRGCFFSGFCCTGPGLFGFGLGFVWRV